MRPRLLPAGLTLLPLALSMALGIWALPNQPEQVPVHWGPDGQPDRWGSAAEGLFALPALLLLSVIILAASSTPPAAQSDSAHVPRVVVLGLGVFLGLVGPVLGARLSPAFLHRPGSAWTGFGLVLIAMSLLAPQLAWITVTLVVGLIGMTLSLAWKRWAG